MKIYKQIFSPSSFWSMFENIIFFVICINIKTIFTKGRSSRQQTKDNRPEGEKEKP